MVILPTAFDDLLGVNQVSFAGKEAIDQVPDRDSLSILSRFPAGVKVGGLFLVKRQRGLPVFPWSEVMQLTAYLLGPSSRGVGKKREIRIGFGGLVNRRIFGTLGLPDDDPREWLLLRWGIGCQTGCQDNFSSHKAVVNKLFVDKHLAA